MVRYGVKRSYIVQQMSSSKKFSFKKYKNIPQLVNGFNFDSKKEAKRYLELLMLEKAGEIFDLELQPKFDLMVNGVKIGFYKADFQYVDKKSGKRVVEDVKSKATITPVYRLKKKIMATLGINIQEV